MSKFTPTTKSCSEINTLINESPFSNTYVHTRFDPIDTHGLYNVPAKSVDWYKDRIKSIGGKYIRIVGKKHDAYRIICFALEITPQEALKVKMDKEMETRKQQALESKLAEVQASIIVNDFGATNELAQKKFANMLINGSLDSLLPFESYVCLDKPTDKDEKRIYDIVQKANVGHSGCVGMVTTEKWKMIELATLMNKKITGEDKRQRRRAACLKYGLKFLADCFV